MFDRAAQPTPDFITGRELVLVDEYRETSVIYKQALKSAYLFKDKLVTEDMRKMELAENFFELLKVAKKYDLHAVSALSGYAYRALCYTASFVSANAQAADNLIRLHDDIIQFATKHHLYDHDAKMATSDPAYRYYIQPKAASPS